MHIFLSMHVMLFKLSQNVDKSWQNNILNEKRERVREWENKLRIFENKNKIYFWILINWNYYFLILVGELDKFWGNNKGNS